MKIKFLGGADIVGRMGMLMEHKGANLIFEYGMKPSDPPSYPMPSPPVEYAFLTHCHLDHSGMIPWLCGRYDTSVIATPSTISVSNLLLKDSLKVADLEGYPKPFEHMDIKTAMRNFIPMDFGDTMDLAGFEIELHSAGHIPGATMYELRGEETTLYSGDIHTSNTRLVWGVHPVKCDNLIVEATYAGRYHTDREGSEQEFVRRVKEVVERGGKVVAASFAVGRTQEIMMILKNLNYDMYVDGMGRTVNRLYLDHPKYLRSKKSLKKARAKFKEVRSPAGRRRAMKGEVIVTTSGMIEGGPVMSYLEAIKDDPKSALFLTGYQVQGTNGRKLMDEGVVDIDGVEEKLSCEVQKFDFSAHADHGQLLEFIHACDPEKVVLCHSDHREILASDIKNDYQVFLPGVGEEIEL